MEIEITEQTAFYKYVSITHRGMDTGKHIHVTDIRNLPHEIGLVTATTRADPFSRKKITLDIVPAKIFFYEKKYWDEY